MKKHSLIRIFFLNICFCATTLSAQQSSSLKSGYIAFDKLVGIQNTSLYQGTIYNEKYRTINDRKQFFKSTQFLLGTVWYYGQPYFNQRMKYDVYEDELLLKLEEGGGGGNTIKLAKRAVDSFIVDSYHFINLDVSKSNDGERSSFYQVLFQGDMLQLYVKHRKNITEVKDKENVYYEFGDIKKMYLLSFEGAYHRVNSKKEVIDLFPEHKKEITTFYKRAKKIHAKDSNAFWLMLVKQIEPIL